MPYSRSLPQLSIIVPTLNEEGSLVGLFESLAGQRDLVFEVLLSDGGSEDGTQELAKRLASLYQIDLRVTQGERGRGIQLNKGARMARSETLLFLHADSQFASPSSLCRSVAFLDAAIAKCGDDAVAGRFALRFAGSENPVGRGYGFYEAKARLNRPECIHGDQGFLLRKSFFERVGPFDESLPFLEDCRLAEKISHSGQWLLLPDEIWTSVRRFQVEGLRRRQILNAIIMNFHAIGWDSFFAALPSVYHTQCKAGRLDLLPFFRKIRELMGQLSLGERFRLWYATGSYVRGNAWQLVFAWRYFRKAPGGEIPGQDTIQILDRFDRRFGVLTDHLLGRLLTACLVWWWFIGSYGWMFTCAAANRLVERVKNLLLRLRL